MVCRTPPATRGDDTTNLTTATDTPPSRARRPRAACPPAAVLSVGGARRMRPPGAAPGRVHSTVGRPPVQLFPTPSSWLRRSQPASCPPASPRGSPARPRGGPVPSCRAGRRRHRGLRAPAGQVLVWKTRSPWRSQHVHAPYPSPLTRSSSSSTMNYQCWVPMNSMNGASSAYQPLHEHSECQHHARSGKIISVARSRFIIPSSHWFLQLYAREPHVPRTPPAPHSPGTDPAA